MAITHFWRLNGNSNDAVGSANGSDTNITYYKANGILNEGAGFNGLSSLITLSVKPMPIGAKSISFVFKSNYTGDYQMIYDDSASGTSTKYGMWCYILPTTGYLQIGQIKPTNLGLWMLESTINVCDGKKKIITITWDGTVGTNTAKMYINGCINKEGNGNYIETQESTHNGIFGRPNYYTNVFWLNGGLDEFIINNTALSAGIVKNRYTYYKGFF